MLSNIQQLANKETIMKYRITNIKERELIVLLIDNTTMFNGRRHEMLKLGESIVVDEDMVSKEIFDQNKRKFIDLEEVKDIEPTTVIVPTYDIKIKDDGE
jgi:hypothetical protein